MDEHAVGFGTSPGEWFQKWDQPSLALAPEVVEAWEPILAGHAAAQRVAAFTRLLNTGKDSELAELKSDLARKLRLGYANVWRNWVKLDSDMGGVFGCEGVSVDPNAESMRAAGAFDMEVWWRSEFVVIREELTLGVRAGERFFALAGTVRPQRRVFNRVLGMLGNEVDMVGRALGG